MTKETAKNTLRDWWRQPDALICEAFDALVPDREHWFRLHPELLENPRDSVDESTLGVHQRWDCNLMPFQQIEYHGQTIYVFEHHVQDLIDS